MADGTATPNTTLRQRFQRILLIIGAGAIAASALVAAPAVNLTPAPEASAANGADFDPGMIIADSVFYNPGAYSEAQVQAFLESKVGACRAGYTCLKDYWMQTTNQSAKSEGCAAYTGRWERASSIIKRVADACGVNPQAIIVLLEKEQSLITDDWPTDRQYRSATGYGCPDTADCDINYYGFFNQVYNAVWQFKKYQARPLDRGYIAGRNNNILWHPNGACGSSTVYIQNQATAGLYIYTPYRPNQAALNNLYGTGDGCSAYGNRNFWRIFTDWFGSTKGGPNYPVVNAIGLLWNQMGGLSGSFGQPTGPEFGVAGGAQQEFVGGTIYWSPATSTMAMSNGPARSGYVAAGGPAGPWGFPTSNGICAGAGCYQNFQKGRVFVTSANAPAYFISSKLVQILDAAGGPTGTLGFPISNETAVAGNGGGTVTTFAGGTVYSSPRATVTMTGTPIHTAYTSAGGPAGGWGWPVAAQAGGQPDGGTYQQFTGGHVYYTAATGAVLVTEKFNTVYKAAGGPGGELKYPTAGEAQIAGNGGGSVVKFQGGSVYSSRFGTYQVSPMIQASYDAAGGANGSWGWPAAAPKCGLADGGCSQTFSNLTAYGSSKTAAQPVTGQILNVWAGLGHTQGSFGYPLEAAKPVAGGIVQKFQGGTIYQSSVATKGVPAIIDAAYTASGGPAAWGWPTGAAGCKLAGGGCSQEFQNGTVFHTTATGARLVKPGTIYTEWVKSGHVTGTLGYPTSSESEVAANGGGTTQSFQKGTLYAQAGKTARQVIAPLRTGYTAANGPAGAWGWPTDAGKTGLPKAGSQQLFSNGTVYQSTATGAQLVSGAIRSVYAVAGGPASTYGYPAEAAKTVTANGGGTSQKFEAGTIYNSRFGTYTLPAGIQTAYTAASGPAGAWGWPAAAAVTGLAAGGTSQTFSAGTVYQKATTGAQMVTGPILTEWVKRGFVNGSLGYPKTAATTTGDITRQAFEGGTLELTNSTGKVILK
ncbi:hypothetical protein [Agromyces humi]|uniref:hypothetical protein n=1 Tax=Agromyces humi TaxID=1766800 RepID=UPI001356B2BB|nr:hypothetical protein [Agromyces humi]